MKKILAVVLAAMMLLSCAAVFAEGETATVQTGYYHFYNSTAEKVTSLYLIDKVSGKVSENYAGEGMEAGAELDVVYEAPAEEEGHGLLLIVFITESGYVGTFVKLSIEGQADAYTPIQLLSADAMTGATMIDFHAPEAK